MPDTSNNWFQTVWMPGVVQTIQSRGYLLRGTALNGSINGSKARWLKGGRLVAQEIDRAVEELEAGNSVRSYVETDLKDYAAAEYVKITDLNKMPANEIAQAQMEAAMAIGREYDYIHLRELQRAAEASEVATIGDGSASIDILDTMNASGQIQGLGGDLGMTFCVLPMFAYQRLLLVKEFNNADYTGPDLAFSKMTMSRTWHFTQYMVMPDKHFEDCGLKPASDEFYGFMWHQSALGFVNNGEVTPIGQYQARLRSWLIDYQLNGAAKILQPTAAKRLHFAFVAPTRLA
jgi:hypothetical protein